MIIMFNRKGDNMKPIIFNTEMVQAILEGRKTVTRRVIKPQPPEGYDYSQGLSNLFYAKFLNSNSEIFLSKTPYMAPCLNEEVGDTLYVRETWCKVEEDVDSIFFEDSGVMYNGQVLYRADGIDLTDIGKWRPSIHMPKKAARIFLEVTDVRVERLQDITEEQAIKEGVGNLFIDHIAYSGEEKYNAPSKRETLAIEQFELLWNSTIKKQDLDRYGWEANPWVWVIEFKRIEKPEQIS